MLVSLSIKHFKSIREAHIRFGPFTCFTGHNGAGKSNLFDAIHFLAALADRDVSGAAIEVRRTSDGGYSPLDLVFGRDPERRIELCARMVVPSEVEDDFGQAARPSASLLIYAIRLRYEPESDRLLVEHESLTPAEARGLPAVHRIRFVAGIQEVGRCGRTTPWAADLDQGRPDPAPRRRRQPGQALAGGPVSADGGRRHEHPRLSDRPCREAGVGGSPVNPKLRQLAFEFGSAR